MKHEEPPVAEFQPAEEDVILIFDPARPQIVIEYRIGPAPSDGQRRRLMQLLFTEDQP